MTQVTIAPTLLTPRTQLRTFCPADTAAYATTIFRDPEVMRYLNVYGRVPPNPVAYAAHIISKRRAEWAERGYSAWALVCRADGAFMGHVGLYIIDGTDVVEVGYALGRAYWGHGYATEAARATLDFAFKCAGLQTVVGIAFPQNIASRRVLQKLGMQDHGYTDRFYGVRLAYYTLHRSGFLTDTPSVSRDV
jgi:RimJ/RimL family protein N-acetyltransferase